MDAGIVHLKVHHGGAFSKEGIFSYIGGQTTVYRNCDTDRMSYFDLLHMLKEVGCVNGEQIFYRMPGRSLDVGLDEIRDDNSVLRMLTFATPNDLLEIYIQPMQEHHASLSENIGEGSQAPNVRKVRTIA